MNAAAFSGSTQASEHSDARCAPLRKRRNVVQATDTSFPLAASKCLRHPHRAADVQQHRLRTPLLRVLAIQS